MCYYSPSTRTFIHMCILCPNNLKLFLLFYQFSINSEASILNSVPSASTWLWHLISNLHQVKHTLYSAMMCHFLDLWSTWSIPFPFYIFTSNWHISIIPIYRIWCDSFNIFIFGIFITQDLYNFFVLGLFKILSSILQYSIKSSSYYTEKLSLCSTFLRAVRWIIAYLFNVPKILSFFWDNKALSKL